MFCTRCQPESSTLSVISRPSGVVQELFNSSSRGEIPSPAKSKSLELGEGLDCRVEFSVFIVLGRGDVTSLQGFSRSTDELAEFSKKAWNLFCKGKSL